MPNRTTNEYATRRRAGPRRPPVGKPASARASAKPNVTPQSAPGSTPEERQRLIAEVAYYIAERRGFSAGRELDDWLEAEATVAAQSRKG